MLFYGYPLFFFSIFTAPLPRWLMVNPLCFWQRRSAAHHSDKKKEEKPNPLPQKSEINILGTLYPSTHWISPLTCWGLLLSHLSSFCLLPICCSNILFCFPSKDFSFSEKKTKKNKKQQQTYFSALWQSKRGMSSYMVNCLLLYNQVEFREISGFKIEISRWFHTKIALFGYFAAPRYI